MPPIQPIENGVRGLVYFQVVWISCVSSVPHQTAASTVYPTQHAGIATVPNASLFASATTRLIPTDSTCGQLFTIAQRSPIFRRKFVDTLGQAFQSGPLNFQGDLARRKIRAAGRTVPTLFDSVFSVSAGTICLNTLRGVNSSKPFDFSASTIFRWCR
jgi:hypothetical protein